MQPIEIPLTKDNGGSILLTTKPLKDQKIVNKTSIVKYGIAVIKSPLQRFFFQNIPIPHLILVANCNRRISSIKKFKISSEHLSNS